MATAHSIAVKQEADFLRLVSQQTETWLFAYGSLMWKRDFPARAYRATLAGWQRRFCIASTIYRGTPARPGLVLGLDAGGHCQGQALLLSSESVLEVMAEVWRREMTNSVYIAKLLPVHLPELALQPLCWCFVSDTANPQYRPPMSKSQTLAIIKTSHGTGGDNLEYLHNTYEHLAALGVDDAYLADLCH